MFWNKILLIKYWFDLTAHSRRWTRCLQFVACLIVMTDLKWLCLSTVVSPYLPPVSYQERCHHFLTLLLLLLLLTVLLSCSPHYIVVVAEDVRARRCYKNSSLIWLDCNYPRLPPAWTATASRININYPARLSLFTIPSTSVPTPPAKY